MRPSRLVVPVLACVLGVVMAHHPMLGSGLRRIQTDPVDPRLINYLLEHTYRWTGSAPGHRDFWSPPVFYPARNVTAYSDTLLTVAPPYWILRLAGSPPDTAFQLWMLAISVLNFVAFYWLLRGGFGLDPRAGGGWRVEGGGFGLDPLAATAGAFLFAFGAPRVNQVGHQQLLPHFYTVLALGALIRVFADPAGSRPLRTAGWLVVASLSLAAQFYAGFYFGWFLVFALAIATAAALAWPPWRGPLLAVTRRNVPALAGAAVVGVAALAPLVIHTLRAVREVGLRSYLEVSLTVPDARSWFYLGPESWLWGWLPRLDLFHGIPLEQAQRMGIGLVTPLVCLAGCGAGWRQPLVRLITVVALIFAAVVMVLPRDLVLGLGMMLVVLCGWGALDEGRGWPWRLAWVGPMVALGLALFPVMNLALGLALTALPTGAAEVLRARGRPAVRRLAPLAWVLFLGLTSFPERLPALGLGLLGPPLVRAWLRRRGRRLSLRMSAGLAATVIALLVIFPDQVRLWKLVYQLVPGGGAIRAVSRVGVFFLIAESVGLAHAVTWLRGARRPVVLGGVLLACLLEQGVTTPSYDKLRQRAEVAEVARRIDPRAGAFFYSTHEAGQIPWKYHLDAMWAQLGGRVPTVNGYSGHAPPGWGPLYEAQVRNELEARRVAAALRAWLRARGLAPASVCWIGGRPELLRGSTQTGQGPLSGRRPGR